MTREEKRVYNADYAIANRDRIRARRLAREAANPERTKLLSKAARERAGEKRLDSIRRWRAANIERRRAYRKAKYAAGREVELAAMRAYKATHKVEMAAQQAAKHRANKHIATYRASLHRAKIKRATPLWADKVAIKSFYLLAQLVSEETGVRHVVDHIVPLKSDTVCGLHWHGNLAVIPSRENVAKLNRHWPDMPDLDIAA